MTVNTSTSPTAQMLFDIKVSMTVYIFVTYIDRDKENSPLTKLIASSHLHDDENPSETDPVTSRAPVLIVGAFVCVCVYVYVHTNTHVHIILVNVISLCVSEYARLSSWCVHKCSNKIKYLQVILV